MLDAPSLHQAAQESPLGTRRTVSLDVTGPVASLSRTLGLVLGGRLADQATGRTPGRRTRPRRPDPQAQPKPCRPPHSGVAPTSLPPARTTTPPPRCPSRSSSSGDSVGLDLGPPLQQALGSYGDVTTFLDGRIDTGLSRPDYFNWPAELHIDLANDQPNLVVVMIGANDPQGLVTPTGSIQYGQPGWDAAYSARVAAFIAEANPAGAHVLWVGMPPMQNPGLNAELMHLNALVQAQVDASRGGAAYLSSTPRSAPPRRLHGLPAQRRRGRDQHPHPRRHPPESGGWYPPGRRGHRGHPDPAPRPARPGDRGRPRRR